MRLFIATTNPNKLREIGAVLTGANVQLASLADIPPIAEPDETGATFEENARLKAFYYARHVERHIGGDVMTVAEDSGLVIDALGGEPGVRSARFLRTDATYAERFAEIERRLALVPGRPRNARFICALAVVGGGRLLYETTGVIEGEISATPRGSGGFGYDPIFYYPPYRQTLAEAGEEQKLRVAHRGHAFRKLAVWLGEEGT
jgi:XTP/dITP diphosphohydrolase